MKKDDSLYIIQQLELNRFLFSNLFTVKSSDEYLWKPEKDKWCLLEIVCHMLDEEVFDFRARVKTAMDPEKYPFTTIDPIGWVTSKNYMGSDYDVKVNEWKIERMQSVKWLRSLDNPNWNSSFEHKKFGNMTAGLFLANWLAHDQLHIRQINRLKRSYLELISGENLSYAGKW